MAAQNVAINPAGTQSAVQGPEQSNSVGFHLHHHQLHRARELAGHDGVACRQRDRQMLVAEVPKPSIISRIYVARAPPPACRINLCSFVENRRVKRKVYKEESDPFSSSRRLPYRTANPNPTTIIVTGGASITKIARLIARCASFGVAFAFALHIAHPCANAGAPHNAPSNNKIPRRHFPLLMTSALPIAKFVPHPERKRNT